MAHLRAAHPPVAERPFDSVWKFARATVAEEGSVVSYCKGAPEVLLRRCVLSNEDRESWAEKGDAYAREGFRVLALAWADGETEASLTLIGLALFWDPPRPEVPEAVRKALAAGIRVIMVTGDHPATALAVAHQIGIPGMRVLTGEDLDDYQGAALVDALLEVNVFARVRPEQKLQLVEALQAQGHIVAMTGDGVNDAPALKRSHVGSCMFNLLILSFMDAVQPEPLSTRAHQGHALSVGFGLILVGIAGLGLVSGARLPVLGWIGVYSPALIAVYFVSMRVIFTHEQHRRVRETQEVAEELRYAEIPLRVAALHYTTAAVLVVGAALWLPRRVKSTRSWP